MKITKELYEKNIYNLYKLKQKYMIEMTDEYKNKFIRKIMKDGKLYASKKIYNKILKELGSWRRILLCILKCAPRVIVRKSYSIQARLNNNYEIVPLKNKRSYCYAIKYIIDAARKRTKSGISISKALILELKEANNNQGQAYRKKIQIYQQVLGNRGYLMAVNN